MRVCGIAQYIKNRRIAKDRFHRSIWAEIGTRGGGTAAGLAGSYDTVAQRIAEFHRTGIELFMLQFQPFETDMRGFAEQVIPRVRRLLA